MWGISTNIIVGILGTLITAIAGAIGVYIKSTRDRGDSRETRYEDGMWKTIDMLTAKVEVLEKVRTEQNQIIDTLRNEKFELQQKFYSNENLLNVANGNLERCRAELLTTQEALKAAQLSANDSERLQQQISGYKDRQNELLEEINYWKRRIENMPSNPGNQGAQADARRTDRITSKNQGDNGERG